MKTNKSKPAANPEARIAELVQAIHAAETELQQMTGGQVDAVVTPGQQPYLLREAQDKLRLSEVAQRSLAETLTVETRRLYESQAVAHVGTWETNLSTLEVTWTEETYRIFEVSPDEFQPNHERFLEFVHPDDRAKVQAAFVNSQGCTDATAIDHRICLPDGRIKFVEERWQTFNDETGKPARAVGTCHDITARAQAEETRRKAEELSSAIVASALDAIITIDHESHILEFNPSAEAVFGWPKAAVLGRDLSEVIIPERMREGHRRGIARYLATGEKKALDRRMELPAMRADGTEILIELNATRLGQSTPPQFTAFLRDITQQKRAEHALAESRERYRDLVESSHDVIYTVSPEGQILFINEACRKVLGYAPAELIGRHWVDLIPAERKEQDLAVFAQIIQSGEDHTDYLAHALHKNGSTVVLRANSRSLLDKEGKLIGRTGTARDVTESLKAEEILRASESRFRALFDQAAVGMCLASTNGRFLRTNHRFCEIVGYSDDELLARDCIETTHPDDRAREAEIVTRMLAGELQTHAWEKRYLHRDGHPVWCNLTLSLMPGDRQQEARFVGVIEDITEQRKAVEQLRQREGLLRIAGRMAQMGGWSVDFPEMRITWSDEVCAIHDMPPGTVPALDQAISFYVPGSRELISRAFEACSRDGTPYDLVLQVVTARGREVWVRSIGQAEHDAAGTVIRVQGAFQDITERKEAELKLERANRALKLLSTCNEALVRAENEDDLLAAFCRHSLEIGGYRMAWVGYAQDDAARLIKPIAAAGDEDNYLTTIHLSWSEKVPEGKGPAGRAIRSGKAVVCEDITRDAEFFFWKDRALAAGFRSVICLPLHTGDHTFGVLGLYSSEVNHPGADELKLLQELADDLSFGIGNLRSRQQRRRMEVAVMKVATSVSTSVSEDFFFDLAKSIAEALDAQAAFVARLLPGESIIARTVAAVVDGKAVDNFEYPLRGTPCESLTDKDDCIFPVNVAGQFPESPSLQSFRAQAYVGRRLVNAAGQTVGLIFVLFREPLKDSGFVVSTLQIFATRAAGEFERLEADTRIREQAALLDKATDAIFVRDLEHRVVFWNQGAEKMYGWTAAEVRGRFTPEFLYPDPRLFHPAVEALIDKGEWAGELEKKNKAGEVLTAECRWTLVRSASGAPESVLCIETNITERKKLEAQFLRAQRLESVGTLASGIAHDMNNILAPIMMAVDLLKSEAKDEGTLELLNTLESCSHRGADLVRQILSFTRGVESMQVAVDLRHLIKELQKVMKEVFPKDVKFDISFGADLWMILGDPSQLHQVFLNLCVNARDAMPHGGKLTLAMENVVLDEIYAAMNPDGKTGPYVVITVTDTGTGMPPKVLDKIFEPFFTTKELGKGTGLGLSTVIGIVKNHGGFVNVYSEEGKGTNFKVYLPAQTSESQLKEVSVTQTGIPRGNGELILLVDDEKGIREIALKTLTRFGYRVIEAENGATAVALYVQHQKDIALVLTDVSMPIMDGAALVTALKSVNPDVRILVSSGLPTNGGLAKAMESGVRQFVPKPYTAEKMLGIIHKEINS